MVKGRYTILCACGSSIATSTVMASKVKDLLKQHGCDANIKKTTYAVLDKDVAALKPDLVITSTDIKKDLGVPTLVGLAFLTGVGKAELGKKILETLNID
ncbi:MAG TPA: PTS galactitol transporter subunit IIB [Thermoanaerobacterales bacterium]|nr:PTS galactitol transporter subunit IIB [Thermoanaerobacterales bacterium]